MARPKGSFDPAGRKSGSGRKDITGHRSARMALNQGDPLRGLALQAQEQALDRYETEGVYLLSRDNASRIQAVADCHWNAYLAAEQADERNPRLVLELGQRVVGYLVKATAAWVDLEEMRKAKDANVVDYELSLEQQRDD